MPSVRIRTHDPEAISFFSAKLADCGFDVEFAAPGQRVRGEVDLEITVNYTKESSANRRQARKVAAAGRPAAHPPVEWTTPYHVDAPELQDEINGDRSRRNDFAEDRDLARILAGGSNRGEMFVIGIREDLQQDAPQVDQPVPEANLETLESVVPPQPRVTPKPASPAPQPAAPTRLARNSPAPNPRPARPRSRMPRRSFLQRNAASAAAMIFLAAIFIFYVSLFGTPKPPTSNSQPQNIPPQAASTATPVSSLEQPAASPATDAIPGLTQADPADLVKPSPSIRHSRPTGHQKPQPPESSTQEEPEVTVRHFPTVQE